MPVGSMPESQGGSFTSCMGLKIVAGSKAACQALEKVSCSYRNPWKRASGSSFYMPISSAFCSVVLRMRESASSTMTPSRATAPRPLALASS